MFWYFLPVRQHFLFWLSCSFAAIVIHHHCSILRIFKVIYKSAVVQLQMKRERKSVHAKETGTGKSTLSVEDQNEKLKKGRSTKLNTESQKIFCVATTLETSAHHTIWTRGNNSSLRMNEGPLSRCDELKAEACVYSSKHESLKSERNLWWVRADEGLRPRRKSRQAPNVKFSSIYFQFLLRSS